MGFFTGIGDFFRGAFGEDDEEKKRRKQREAQEAAQRRAAQQQQPKPQQQQNFNQPKVTNVNQLFGAKNNQVTDPLGITKPKLQQEQPATKPAPVVNPNPTVPKPVVQPPDAAQIRQKAMEYQTPKVQDVNNYYGNDLKVLQDELAKGDKTDYHRVQGIMTSLDNRKKELTEFHKQRGEAQSFKSARELEDTIKSTRGDWTKENQKLKQFWDGVSKGEKDDFLQFLAEKNGVDKNKVNQADAAAIYMRTAGSWKNGNGGMSQFGMDFTEDKDKVKAIQERQRIADIALSPEIKDVPLDQLGGFSVQQYLDDFKTQSPEGQRYIMQRLEKHMTDNENNHSGNPDLERKYKQSVLLYNALGDSGLQRDNFHTRASKFKEGAGKLGSGLIESPKHVIQSADALSREWFGGGEQRGDELTRLHQEGKITDAEYNEKLNQNTRDTAWAGTGKEGRGHDVLVALGTSADTVATFLPVASLVKGGKAAYVTEKLIAQGMSQGLTREAASVAAKEVMKKAITEGTEKSLQRVMAEEALTNAGWSAAGSTREGEIDPSKMFKEAAVGGTVGGLAPAAGAGLTKLWSVLRGANREVPEALEDLGRAGKRAGADTLDDEAKYLDELEAMKNDPNTPADAVARAEEQIKAINEKNAPAAVAADAIDRPAYLHKQDIQNAIEDNTRDLKDYINAHPELTPQQIEVAREAAKERLIQTIETLQKNREASLGAVEGQAAAETAAQTGRVADVQAAQEAQAAAVTPGKGDRVQTPAGNGEVAANDAYAQFNQDAGITNGSQDITHLDAQQELERMAGNKTMDDLIGRQALRIPTAINQKTQGAVADAATNTTGKVTGAALTNQNPLANFFGQVLYGFNKKSTMSNELKSLVEQVRGRTGGIGNLREQVVAKIEAPLARLGDEGAVAAKELVFSAFEKYNNGDMDGALAVIKAFTPEERAYFDNVRELNQLRNNLNHATMDRGIIDQYDNGMHMPRLYDMDAFAKEFSPDDVEAFARSQNRTLDLNPAKRRKQLEDISAELQDVMLRDPAQASAIRTEIALHNKAISEYSASVGALPGAVSDANKRGFLQIPEQARYGELAGKYVRRDLAEPMLSGDLKFKSDTYRAVNTLLNKYQSSIMGKMEQGLRKGLTTYNPATRMGNRGANLTQGAMAGFNLPEMAVQQQHFINVLKNGGDEWTRLAKTFGAIDDNEALGRMAGGYNEPQRGLFKGARERLTQSYSDVDTAAKVAMFKWQIQRGAAPEEAARFVNRALPNIGNSGEVYTFFSRLPVLGTPFRAIQPEVLRALGSTMGRNTVPFLVAMATYTTLQNATWDDVPPEEREQIQNRFGSGQTPFKGINDFFGSKGIPTDKVLPSSWSFNAAGVPGLDKLFATDPETGDKPVVDVDTRRLMGMYSINLGGDSAADSVIDQTLKASPANIPVGYNDGKWEFQPQNIVASRLFSPLWQAAIDKDFRGKSVQSPERDGVNVVDPNTGQPLDKRDDPKRALEYILRSYVPQVTDVSNVVDAQKGEKNFYDQKMNTPQAVARLFGLKGEQFDDERLKDMDATKAYFDDKAAIDKQLEGMTPNEQQAWKRLTGYDKLNKKEANSFGGESWVKAPVFNFSEDKWKDFASNPRLYDLMVQKKAADAARDGSPVQPEFDERLSASFRKQLIQNKMVAPGDDAELDQRMHYDPEWDYYMQLKDNYKAKAKDYYGEGDDNFSDELVKHQDAKFPEKPALLKAYSAAYSRYADGKGTKPEFTDQLKAAKEAYNKETFLWTNTERRARGLPAITWDVWNNPTFGFDSTPSTGYGSGNGDYNPADHINTLSELTHFSNDVGRYKPIEAEAMPNIVAMFQKLMAGSGGGRQKPKLGASSRGQ